MLTRLLELSVNKRDKYMVSVFFNTKTFLKLPYYTQKWINWMSDQEYTG